MRRQSFGFGSAAVSMNRPPAFSFRSHQSRAAVAVAAVIALVLGFFLSSAPAQAEEVSPDHAMAMLQPYQESADPDLQALPADQRDTLLRKHAGELVSQSGVRYSRSAAQALRTDTGQTLLRLPAEDGQNLSYPSALTLVLDKDGQVSTLVEMVFVETSATAATGRAWTDGDLTFNKSIDLAGTTTPMLDDAKTSTLSARSTGYVKGDWWGNLNKCLSAQGIPWAVIALLGTVCAAVCIGTAGTGCILCLAAASGGSGGVIGGCVYKANTYS